jgi:hypothetical protein
MRILIQRNETSVPIEYDDALSTYTKGPLFCVMFKYNGARQVHKYPLCSLFRVHEDYDEFSEAQDS